MCFGKSGYTIVELLVVALILIIASVSIGTAFVNLSSIELLNREKARTLEALCRHYAKTQPFVSAGSLADCYTDSVGNGVCVSYPHIVFGIACETNNFTQVTNTYIFVKNDGILRTSICAARSTGNRSSESSFVWMDPIFVADTQPNMADCSVTTNINNTVLMHYKYEISVGEMTPLIELTVPVSLRNSNYR